MNEVKDYILICPKCGKVGGFTSLSNDTQFCKYCKTELLETDLDVHSYAKSITDGTVDIIERRLFERYVKDNPLYDPDEAELSEAKFQHKKKLHEAEYAAEQASKPHCPICDSTDIVRINGLRKGLSIVAFGLFSNDIGKTMQCKHCGHKF